MMLVTIHLKKECHATRIPTTKMTILMNGMNGIPDGREGRVTELSKWLITVAGSLTGHRIVLRWKSSSTDAVAKRLYPTNGLTTQKACIVLQNHVQNTYEYHTQKSVLMRMAKNTRKRLNSIQKIYPGDSKN